MDDKAREESLSRMANLLNSDGINYTVFLKSYSCIAQGGDQIEDIVKKLVGKDTTVRAAQNCDLRQMTEVLNDCLGYVGDTGAGPGPDVLRLPEFSNLLGEIVSDFANLSKRSNEVKSFSFVEGHPAYPVFWEFAFLFLMNDSHRLIVGSSSD